MFTVRAYGNVWFLDNAAIMSVKFGAQFTHLRTAN